MSTPAPSGKRVLYYSAARPWWRLLRVRSARSRSARPAARAGTAGHLRSRAFRFTVRHGSRPRLPHPTSSSSTWSSSTSRAGAPTDVDHVDFEQGVALWTRWTEPDVERRSGSTASSCWSRESTARGGCAHRRARRPWRGPRDARPLDLPPAPGCTYLPPRAEVARRVLEEMGTSTMHRRVGKLRCVRRRRHPPACTSRWCSLKCLEDCCGPGALNDFDLYYGIQLRRGRVRHAGQRPTRSRSSWRPSPATPAAESRRCG